MGILDNFKDLFKVAETVNNIELYKKLSELQTAVHTLEEENHSLKEHLRERDNQQTIAGQLRARDNAYYREEGGTVEGPFCMRCWDVDGKLVRERLGATAGTHYCAECRNRRS
jgi:regulator of replication initiation timing